MQEKTAPVFAVAPGDDISELPQQLLRFIVDLPNEAERQAIWSIVIQLCGRNLSNCDLPNLAEATDGLTRAKIRSAVLDALFNAFEDDRTPDGLGIMQVLEGFVPLSRKMTEPIRRPVQGNMPDKSVHCFGRHSRPLRWILRPFWGWVKAE